MQPARLDLCVTQGATMRKPLRLMQPQYVWRDISAISKTAPVRLTVTAHDLPGEDWPVWIEGVSGWSALNRAKETERFRLGVVVDANTVEFNSLNGSNQNASGGKLVYQPPVDLTACTGSLTITWADGTTLLLTTENGGLVVAGLGRLMLILTAAQTAALTPRTGTYLLLITDSVGDVTPWAAGDVRVTLGAGNG